MATNPKKLWTDYVIAEIPPTFKAVIQQSFARWMADNDMWAWVVQALRDGRNLRAFQRQLLDDSVHWGLPPDAVGALISASINYQIKGLYNSWRFLVKSPVKKIDLPDILYAMDSWFGAVPNIIGQVRANPYLLIQADTDILPSIFPDIDPKKRRKAWLQWLHERWAHAPHHDPHKREQWRKWAAVLAVLLDRYEGRGDTYVYLRHPKAYDNLVRPTFDSLREYLNQPSLSDDEARQIIYDAVELCEDKDTPVNKSYGIIRSKDDQYERIAWMWIYQGERAVADQVLARTTAASYDWPDVGDAIIQRGYSPFGSNTYAPFDLDQQKAIRHAYTRPVSMIAAPPGTGKTAVIWALHEIASHDPSLQQSGFFVMTPTGRAARVVNQRVPNMATPAATLHSRVALLLSDESRGGTNLFPEQLNGGFVIVDESFMADAGILGALVRRMGSGGRLVLVGDPDQLLPVSGGCPALDIFMAVQEAAADSLILPSQNPVVSLRINHRSVPAIPHNARALLRDPELDPNGQVVTDSSGSIVIAQHQWDAQAFPQGQLPADPEKVFGFLANAVLTWEHGRPTRTPSETVWHVVTPRRAAADHLNRLLRNAIFPHQNAPWVVGERVVQLKNDYLLQGVGLRNGDFGHITEVHDDGRLTAVFASGEFTVNDVYANKNWGYGYATTIHKAQGGEWPFVAMVEWPTQWCNDGEPDSAGEELDFFRERRHFYTAWTRARDCMVFCSPHATEALEEVQRPLNTKRQSNGKRKTRVLGWLRYGFKNQGGLRAGGPAVRQTL